MTPPHANAKPKNKSQVLILESPEQIKAWGFLYDKNIMPRGFSLWAYGYFHGITGVSAGESKPAELAIRGA